jgi:D-glycero-beta-D-manno-heptose-7-phosphate kinase
MENFQELFDKFSNLKVGVIGDVMMDTYIWGETDRISPEAPVPIVSLKKKEFRIGGAGNVALNAQSLGATSFIISVTGKDEDARILQDLFDTNNINTAYSFASTDRITTSKTRVISRNQHMMRLDAEITSDLNEKDEEQLLNNFDRFLKKEKPHVVILQDYNKGIMTKTVIEKVIRLCKQHNVATTVDPKRKNFLEYQSVDVFKPNMKEVKEALNLIYTDTSPGSLTSIHKELSRHLKHKISFITLSEKGVFYQQEDEYAIIPSHLRNIADVSGAGDTVIAVASLVYAATKNPFLMSEIANIAGGMVCEEVGTVAINRIKLLHECELLLS